MKERRITAVLLTEVDLEKAEKNKNYNRRQSLLDSINFVTTWAIYFFPLVIIILFIILIFHYITTGDYRSIEEDFYHILSAIAGYLIAYLQKNGINGDKG